METKTKNTLSSKRQNVEVEVKLKVRNLTTVRSRLLRLGCQVKTPRSLEDNRIFDFSDQRLREQRQLLRVRQFAGRCLLTFKGPSLGSEQFKIREELETEVRNCAQLTGILERMGMKVSFRYQKFRTLYSLRLRRHQEVNLALDQTPIGNYLEIEGSKADIGKVASRLGYRKVDFITDSYVSLFSRSALGKQQRDMLFAESLEKKTPEAM
jgi:adenylate cyclase class 2